MWRRVDIVLTDVLEERIASIFRVEEKEGNSASKCSVLAPDPRLWRPDPVNREGVPAQLFVY
jgi:hypothetical protein